MEIIYSPKAIKDFDYWKRVGDRKILEKIKNLIVAIENSPFEGVGKPERLKHALSGLWSRRINREHRIIYEVDLEGQIIKIITILSVKGHYE